MNTILPNTESIDIYKQSIRDIDPQYPYPKVCHYLEKDENSDLLNYVAKDPFGCHVFPGDIQNYSQEDFFRDMDIELRQSRFFHLWAYIPTCRYRCHFCQFPVVMVNPKQEKSKDVFKGVVDRNIKEAHMWLKAIPALKDTKVGEFNMFGGTPSLLPHHELRRLMAFYKDHFDFSEATLRLEGEPGTLGEPFLVLLKELGFTKLSFGVQSFSDKLISNCGRRHTSEECFQTIELAKKLDFDLVSIDLMYGLLGQTVDDVKYDLEMVKKYDVDYIVYAKLHLMNFMDTRTGVAEKKGSYWGKKVESLENQELPSLAKQYQMRELVDRYFEKNYTEHPTMYFHKNGRPEEKWKGIITDLDKQYPEIGIGLGGSSKSIRSEVISFTEYKDYVDAIDQDKMPFGPIRGFSENQKQINAFKMALSTLIPVDDEVFKKKFNGKSMFENFSIKKVLDDLERKKLVRIQDNVVCLEKDAEILVEAIINTAFD